MSDLDDEELEATRRLNGVARKKDKERTDINVGSIEKDIKRCEKLTEPQNANWIGISNQLAITHLIEKIKELEEERQIVGMPVRNKRDGKIGIVLHQWESRSIAVLENISPRVINTHDSWDTLEIITDEVKHVKTKDDSIPVQKVKDKIEELKQKREKEPQGTVRDFILVEEIKFLKELLEEK